MLRASSLAKEPVSPRCLPTTHPRLAIMVSSTAISEARPSQLVSALVGFYGSISTRDTASAQHQPLPSLFARRIGLVLLHALDSCHVSSVMSLSYGPISWCGRAMFSCCQETASWAASNWRSEDTATVGHGRRSVLTGCVSPPPHSGRVNRSCLVASTDLHSPAAGPAPPPAPVLYAMLPCDSGCQPFADRIAPSTVAQWAN
jgi:hypothetical protein